MNPSDFVLDTNCLLMLLDGRVRPRLLVPGYAVSIVSEMELLCFPGITPDQEKTIRSFLSQMHMVGLEDAVRNGAIFLRRKYRIKLPDAIVAATGMVMNATVVTDDSHFSRLEEVRISTVRAWSDNC